MSHLLVLIGTGIGWAMIGHVAVNSALRRVSRPRATRRDSEQERLARIARLEIACGVGVKYGAEALRGVGTRIAKGERLRSERHLQEFGGCIARECWACGEDYKPQEHSDWYARAGKSYSLSLYADMRNPDRDPLDETLCPSCLANARAELDYGVPLP